MSWITSSESQAGLSILDPSGSQNHAINGYIAGEDKKKAQEALDKLQNEPLPQFTADPSLLNYYTMNLRGVRNPQGMTAAEKTGYNQDVTNNLNTSLYNVTNTSGGNLSKYISSALNPAIVAGSNRLVAQDQGIKRQNFQSSMGRLGSAVNQFQDLRNRNTSNAWMRRNAIERALGMSILQQKELQREEYDASGKSALNAAGTVIGAIVGGGGGMVAKGAQGAKMGQNGVGGGVGDVETTPSTNFSAPATVDQDAYDRQQYYMWGKPMGGR